MRAFAIIIFAVSAMFVVAPKVDAQSSRAVNAARIEVLERQVKALEARLGGRVSQTANQPVTNNRVVADLSARMGSLEEQLRKLNGRLEEFEYRQRQFEQTIELVQQELALQRSDIAKASANVQANPVATAPSTANDNASVVEPETEVPAAVVPSVELPDGDAKAQYEYAFNFIRKNDLESGRIAMDKFMEVNAGNPLTGNAKFWLGRIYLQQGKNANAAQKFLALIEEHPNHAKRGEALVDLADVLIKLDSSSDACNALLEFRRVEDKATGRLKNRANRLSQQARCN